MPRIRVEHTVRSHELHALRAQCDGCDAARPAEEHATETALWLVTEGAFELRDRLGRRIADPTCALLVATGEPFTIRHPAGPDVCVALRGPLVDVLAGRRTVPLGAHAHAELVAACRARDPLAIAEAIATSLDEPARVDRDLAHALAEALRLSFADDQSVTDLAAAAGASVFHACRVFRRVTGHTLHGFRRELRLRHALAMLLDGDAPLCDIAARVGFASQSHLTNMFRARFRTTPGRVRAARALA